MRIELVDSLPHEPALPHVGLAGLIGIRIGKPAAVPTVGGHVGDGVHPIPKQLPETFQTFHSAREAAPDADDRERFHRVHLLR